MRTVDLGNGQTVPRHHLPKTMSSSFDQASAAFEQVRASIRSWVQPLYALQAPVTVSGSVSCNAVGKTGRTYDLTEPGGAVLVDQRDVDVFTKLGFTSVPSGAAPTTGLRVGLVFLDTSLNEYMRYDGANWAPVTLA
jgi:hypothetical protein